MAKYKLLLTSLVMAFLTTAQAQFTLRVAGGYSGAGIQNTEGILGPSIDPGTPTVDALSILANRNDSLSTYKQLKGSYGAGGNVSLAVGYMFNKYIGIDVAFGYAHSNNISCVEVVSFAPLPLPGYLTANVSSFSYALAVAPSIVITGAKTGWKVYPYSRLGISLPVAGSLTDNISISSPYFVNADNYGWLGNKTEVTMVTKATVSLGLNGTIGVAYRPVPFMSVNLEVNAQYLNVRGKSSTITKWIASGDSAGVYVVDNDLNPKWARSVYRTQFNYVDQLTPQSNNGDPQYGHPVNPSTGLNFNPTQPKQDVRPVVPGSSFGFNVGVTFYLSKKTLKKDTEKSPPKS